MTKEQFHKVLEAVHEPKTLEEIHLDIESGSWTIEMFKKFIDILVHTTRRKD
jgi:hypothetical protein